MTALFPELLRREPQGDATPWQLRVGRWQDVLADVGAVDAVICDPPYGARTHAGNSDMGRFGSAALRNLTYAAWTPTDVQAFVAHWSPRCSGWLACMTSDDLIEAWRSAYADAGRLDFAPVPCLQHRPRLGGDGPGSGAVYLMVARPRRKEFLSWGSLPCWYGPIMAPATTTTDHIGGKPLAWMRAIIRDYTRPSDIVVDPCAGSGTTLIAACKEGRRAIGAEMDPTTATKALRRLQHADLSPPLILDQQHAHQSSLFDG